MRVRLPAQPPQQRPHQHPGIRPVGLRIPHRHPRCRRSTMATGLRPFRENSRPPRDRGWSPRPRLSTGIRLPFFLPPVRRLQQSAGSSGSPYKFVVVGVRANPKPGDDILPGHDISVSERAPVNSNAHGIGLVCADRTSSRNRSCVAAKRSSQPCCAAISSRITAAMVSCAASGSRATAASAFSSDTFKMAT